MRKDRTGEFNSSFKTLISSHTTADLRFHLVTGVLSGCILAGILFPFAQFTSRNIFYIVLGAVAIVAFIGLRLSSDWQTQALDDQNAETSDATTGWMGELSKGKILILILISILSIISIVISLVDSFAGTAGEIVALVSASLLFISMTSLGLYYAKLDNEIDAVRKS